MRPPSAAWGLRRGGWTPCVNAAMRPRRISTGATDSGWPPAPRQTSATRTCGAPRVGRQGQRETREPQDRDDTTPLQDRGETLHSSILLLMHQCGFA